MLLSIRSPLFIPQDISDTAWSISSVAKGFKKYWSGCLKDLMFIYGKIEETYRYRQMLYLRLLFGCVGWLPWIEQSVFVNLMVVEIYCQSLVYKYHARSTFLWKQKLITVKISIMIVQETPFIQ